MQKVRNRTLGYALLGVFGTVSIGSVFNMIFNGLSLYNQTTFAIVWTFLDLISLISLAFIALKRGTTKNVIGKIGAFSATLLFALYTITYFISIFSDKYFLNFFGSYSSIVWSSLLVISMGLLLFDMRIPKGISIVGFISYIPAFFNSFIYPAIDKFWENYDSYSNFDVYESLMMMISISGLIAILLQFTATILILIWMRKREPDPVLELQITNDI